MNKKILIGVFLIVLVTLSLSGCESMTPIEERVVIQKNEKHQISGTEYSFKLVDLSSSAKKVTIEIYKNSGFVKKAMILSSDYNGPDCEVSSYAEIDNLEIRVDGVSENYAQFSIYSVS